MADPSTDRVDEAKADVSDATLKPQAGSYGQSPPLHDTTAAASADAEPRAASSPSQSPSSSSLSPSSAAAPLSASASASASSSSSPSSSSVDSVSDARNLYVDNLALTSDVELRNLFLPYGPILKSRLAVDPNTRQPAGYGFVMFERREDALKAIEGLNQHVLGTKRLRVSVKRSKQPVTQQPQQQSQHQSSKPGVDGAVVTLASYESTKSTPPAAAPSSSESAPSSTAHPPSSHSPSPSPSASPSANLYISGLPVSWRQSDVESLFSPYGRIADSRLLLDRLTGQPRGVAMLRFESPTSASEAIAALHRSYTPPSMQQTVTVKYATDKPTQQPTVHKAVVAAPLSSHSPSAHPAMITLMPGFASHSQRPSLLPTSASQTMQSPSPPPQTSLSVSLTTALRGSPLIRLLHPSDPSHHSQDGEMAALHNGGSPARSASSLSSLSASPPPTAPLNDAASIDSTASTRTSSLSPAVSHSSSPPSAPRRTPNGSNSSAASYHSPARSSGAAKQQSGGSAQQHSPHNAHRHMNMNGSYSSSQQPAGRLTNYSPLPANPSPSFTHSHAHHPHQHTHPHQQQHHPLAAYSATSLPHSAQPSPGLVQQTAGGSGQTHRYSSVGLAASEHIATQRTSQRIRLRQAPIPQPLYPAPMMSNPYLAAHPAAAAAASLYHHTYASPLLALPGVSSSNHAALYPTAHPQSLTVHHHQAAAHPYPIATSVLSAPSPNRASVGAGVHHAALLAAGSAHSHSTHSAAHHMAGMGAPLPLSMQMPHFADPQHSGLADSSAGLSSSLYAYGLPSALTDSDLHELFGIYGGVSSVHIMRNDNGTPKGYAFINMKSVNDAAIAQMYLDHFPISGRTLRVQFKRQHNNNQQQHTHQHQQQQHHSKHKRHSANATPTAAADDTSQQQHYAQPGTDAETESASDSHTG